MIHSRTTFLIPLFSAFLLANAVPANSANLAAHRAYYTLEAARVNKDSGLVSVSGRLAYEIKGSDCEGYAVSYRIANRFNRGEGSETQESDFRFSSFETGDSLSLDVQQSQFMDGTPKSKSRTKLNKPAKDQAAAGEISGDEAKSFTLTADVFLPTEFQKHIVDAAMKGTTRDTSVVYEDTNSDVAMRAISFIGSRKTGLKLTDVSGDLTADALAKLAYWPVTTSYYAVDASGDAEPSYQASFNLLENGISTDLVLDYGSYAMKGQLNKIELFKTDACK
jgi:hypothetical protein